METTERELAEFVSATEYRDLPAGVTDTVTRAFVDTVGVALAGTEAASGGVVSSFMDRESGGRVDELGDAGASTAALALGTAAHALDYDDLSWGMDGHPSVVLVPPILALTAVTDVDGEDAVTAYAVGYEVACAVAEPISPDHYERGWHATATFGAFGATTAAASLLDLDAAETQTALNVAASTPAGTKRNFGSMTKPLHAGLASRSGVTAALLAAEGFTAGTAAIGGERGFWDLYGDRGDSRDRRNEDGEALPRGEWYVETRGVHTKRYPCCYFTHSAIAATADLQSEHDIAAEDVASVTVAASGGANDALSYDVPTTGLEAKFSMPHAVAVALTRERVALDAFEDGAVEDPTLRSLYDRVTLDVDGDLPYDSHAATVEIETTDGRVHTTGRDHPPWVHAHPPTPEELRAKFTECATRAVTAETARDLYERLDSLPENDLDGVLVHF